MKTKHTLTAAVITVLAGIGITGAVAQERGERGDAFADGVLTRAEASEMALMRFDRIDTNEDGFVSDSEQEEAKAAAEARRAERDDGERRGRRGGKRGERGEQGDRMALADTNDDGFVSRDEAREAAVVRFDEADVDGDGEVTRDEMRAQRGGRGGRR